MCEKQVDGKYPTMYPACHTEALAKVSQRQKRDLVDSSLSAKAKNDKKNVIEIFRIFANAQNDKTINYCNDTSNHNRDISPVAQYDTNDLESQIDNLVYQLYDLDSTEIQIIQSLKKPNSPPKTP